MVVVLGQPIGHVEIEKAPGPAHCHALLADGALRRIAGLRFGENLGAWEAAVGGVVDAACASLGRDNLPAQLPFLCAEAVGCRPELAAPVATAWLLGYIAARLLDAVQDTDFCPGRWAGLSPAQAINVATAFLAAIPLALDGVEERGLGVELGADFWRVARQAAVGQHADLAGWVGTGTDAVDRYWQVAAAKTGSMFALSCRSGARLGTRSDELLAVFAAFGNTIGLLLQACDDYHDVYTPGLPANSRAWAGSLPMVFAQTVGRPEDREQIGRLLPLAATDGQAAACLRQILDGLGARCYLLAQVDLLGQQAHECLERVRATGHSPDPLCQAIGWIRNRVEVSDRRG